MFLGGTHTGFFQNLKREGTESSRIFSSMPYVYSFGSEVERRFMFGKKVGDELVARVFLEKALFRMFYDDLSKITNDTAKIWAVFRELISKFSLNDIRKIFYDLQRIKDARRAILLERLHEKGLKVPESKEDLNQLLSKTNSYAETAR